MKSNHLYDAIDKKIKTLEIIGKNDINDVEKLSKTVNSLLTISDLSDEEKLLLQNRVIELYSNSINKDAALTKRYLLVDKKKLAKIAGAAAGLVVLVGGIGYSLTACGGKTVEPAKTTVETEAPTVSDNTISDNIVSDNMVKEAPIVLSENLTFDPNSNDELVARLSEFIADSWSKGIDVPVDKMMDYYLVMNIEDINPVDYARLNYNNKTVESIMSNYFYCANAYMDDALTVLPDTEVDYSKIVADKDSAASLVELQTYIAGLNAKTVDKKTVHDFIIDRYIGDDIADKENIYNLYNAGANNQAYIMMFSFDEITDDKGLSKAENDILNEDIAFACGQVTEVAIGEKAKSDKSQEETSIINQLKEKLEISRQFYSQDLTNVAAYEIKTGVELEQEITLKLTEMNAKLVENPDFVKNSAYSNGGSISNSKTSRGGSGSGSSYDSGSYGTKKTEAQGVGNVTYTDTTGGQIDPAKAASYAQQGASDCNSGVNNSSSVPAEYQSSYMTGWSAASAEIEKAKAEAKKNEESYFVPAPPSDQTPIEQPPVTPPSNSNEIIEEFIPIDSNETDTSQPEVIEEFIDYTSKINNLNNLKAELFALASSTNIEEKTMKM